MLKFQGCEFSAAGADQGAKVFGLTLKGAEDVLIENCVFNGTGYSAILNQTAGDVTIKNSQFECGNMRNPIEGGQTNHQGSLTVEDCNFEGVPGNNFINFYNVADNSVHIIKNCKFAGGYDNNIIRLSNINNLSATFNIENVSYKFVEGEEAEWSGFLICQDYTNRTGNKQNFNKYRVNIVNLTRPAEGKLFYVYDDGEGIISTNDPYVYLDGALVSNPVE